jgi:predicted GTPase
VVLAYSDLAHEEVMHLASRALAAGADFSLLGPQRTQLTAQRPVIAVSAVRTGCGKSQTTRFIADLLHRRGLKPAVVRHPMPYGDLARQAVQRFASRTDLAAAECTVEEREEYEPHLAAGSLVFAGVDYARILAQAEAEADVILWDGGNNDFPFFRPDLHIVLVDPLRAGHELHYHPGEAVLRMADIVVVAKADAAEPGAVAQCLDNIARLNPAAQRVTGLSPVRLDGDIAGRRVLVIEDGPSTTHGGMPWGAGYHAARAAGAEPIDPRRWASPEIRAVFERYPHLGPILPAMGYSPAQLEALRQTIAAVPVDAVLVATPVDLAVLIPIAQPVVRARYDFVSSGSPRLEDLVDAFLERTLAPSSPAPKK